MGHFRSSQRLDVAYQDELISVLRNRRYMPTSLAHALKLLAKHRVRPITGTPKSFQCPDPLLTQRVFVMDTNNEVKNAEGSSVSPSTMSTSRRSVPPIMLRSMNHPEPIRMAGPLRWDWWSRSIAESSQILMRFLFVPQHESFRVANDSTRRGR